MHSQRGRWAAGWLRALGIALAGGAAVGAVAFAALWLSHRTSGGEALRYPWEAMRAFLFRGEDPYRLLALLYGRARQDGVPFSPQIYPFHAALVWFVPLALVRDFAVARAVALVGGGVGLLGAARWLARSVGWQPRGGEKVLLVMAAVGGYGAIWALWRADVAVMVAVLSTVALAALLDGRDGLAGALLALTWVRPELAVGATVWALAWAASRRRWRLWGGFWGLTMALLAVSWWFLPAWPVDVLRLKMAFPPTMSPQLALAAAVPGVGRQVAWAFRLLVALVVMGEWVAAWGRGVTQAVWVLALTLWGALLVGTRVVVADQVLLVPSLVLLMAYWTTHWRRYGRQAAVGLGLLWMAPLAIWAQDLLARRWPSLEAYVMLPLLVGVLLYTIRWWTTRPRTVLPFLIEE